MLLTQTIESVMQIQCNCYWNPNVILKKEENLKVQKYPQI